MSVTVPAGSRVTTEQLHNPGRGRRHTCSQRHDVPDLLGPWPAPVRVRSAQPEVVELPVDRGRAVDRRDGVAGFVPRVRVRVVAVGNVGVTRGRRYLILEVGDAAVHRVVPGERDLRHRPAVAENPVTDRMPGAPAPRSESSSADSTSCLVRHPLLTQPKIPTTMVVTGAERRRNLVAGRPDREIRTPNHAHVRAMYTLLLKWMVPPAQVAQVGVLPLIPDQGGLHGGRVPFQRDVGWSNPGSEPLVCSVFLDYGRARRPGPVPRR